MCIIPAARVGARVGVVGMIGEGVDMGTMVGALVGNGTGVEKAIVGIGMRVGVGAGPPHPIKANSMAAKIRIVPGFILPP
jgi:hypothetical protein